ncbi:MAG: DUF364 domain-containing protein [Eubacteriales bacterium]|nr:DUF364 domain-containing protein [Eubacteriales bacterium]
MKIAEGWMLYEALLAGMTGIRANERITEIIRGEIWTGVIAGEFMGVAMSMPDEGRQASYHLRIGMSLREAAQAIYSWNMAESSVAMAAINCYYNQKDCRLQQKTAETIDIFRVYEGLIKEKVVAVIGHFPLPESYRRDSKALYILERRLQEGDYPDSACEYVLSEADYVFITGSTWINKTITRLLQLSRDEVIMTGPSTPMAGQLLGFSISVLAGFCVTDIAGCREMIQGNSCRGIFSTGEMVLLRKSTMEGEK